MTTYTQVEMPAALRREGEQVLWITDSDNGLEADAICICCRHPVIAKQGDQNQWHFAHAPHPTDKKLGTSSASEQLVGVCNRESWLHHAAKRVFIDTVERAMAEGKSLTMEYENSCFHGRHRLLDIITSSPPMLLTEKSYRNVRPDITIMRGGRVTAFVEMIVTHQPETSVHGIGLPVIEFRLRHMKDMWRVRQLVATRIVNHPHPCNDHRRACRKCGGPNSSDLPTCSACRCHDCPQCGKTTYSPREFCSAKCVAASKGMAICECGIWHSDEYETCYECR